MSLYNSEVEDNCEHRWIAGGLYSDWICDDCGLRADIPENQESK